MDVNTTYSTATTYNNTATTNGQATTTANTATNEEGKANSTNTAYVNDVNKQEEASKSYKPDMDAVRKMVKENNHKLDAFRSMVEKLISKQGNVSNNIWQDVQALAKSGNVDQATIDAAKQEIGEDGYYGVKQTSERIFEFAKAISGGDPSKIDELRKAVEKGFESAKKAWGGELPGICGETYDAVMKRFDDWAKESKAAQGAQ